MFYGLVSYANEGRLIKARLGAFRAQAYPRLASPDPYGTLGKSDRTAAESEHFGSSERFFASSS